MNDAVETKQEQPTVVDASALPDLLTGFISVNERLPEDGELVTAYNPMTGPFLTNYRPHDTGKEWCMDQWNGVFGPWYPQATHWQPLGCVAS